ncbi:hypothetical protein HNR00_004770 [Methylorubrum rhodinum]|uniref:Uncharacterized protein n=1 Tax=Methylorubrum rhodinum TaxID=29428 RepID=A0A840ZRQ7_9HYPH|nr:hypothetical protein [Methylorubrum rhodinum]MBB5760030.1 hypothetical protein [Methylorubrum rhodinum]
MSLHKSATVSDEACPTLASSLGLGAAGSATGEPGCGGLDRAYTAFCVMVGVLKAEFGAVPAEPEARAEFVEELIMEAWYSLAEQVDAASDRDYALIGPLVPDLVSARLDHVAPEAFAATLDAQTLATWHRICDLLVDRTMTPVMTASEVAEIVKKRIWAEARLHQPMADMFAESADAR